MKTLTRTATLVLATIIASGTAHAVCGDVNGDGAVRAGDALITLRKAVGQDVPMTCPDAPAASNQMGYTSTIVCNQTDPHATLTWSEHPDLSWQTSVTTAFPSKISPYIEINDLLVQGQLTTHLGACGAHTLDLDAEGAAYLLPNNARVVVETNFEARNATIYWGMQIAASPNDSSLLFGEPSAPFSAYLGSTPAGEGISGIEDLW